MDKKFKVIGNKFLPMHLGLYFRDEEEHDARVDCAGGVVGGVDFETGDNFGSPALGDWLVVHPDMIKQIQDAQSGTAIIQ